MERKNPLVKLGREISSREDVAIHPCAVRPPNSLTNNTTHRVLWGVVGGSPVCAQRDALADEIFDNITMRSADGLRCSLVGGSRQTLVHRSCRRLLHSAFVLFLPLVICGVVKGGDPPPVIVDSIEPTEIVQGHVPQPEIQVFGSDFIEGLPSETNRPTATLPADLINLLPAPLGVYDVIVTRPTDDASDTLEGAFTVTDREPDPGEIALMVRSAWGGPVTDVEVVGNLAYAAIGRRLVILDVADPTNPVELGSLNVMAGVEGVAVRDGYAFLGAHKPYRFCVADVSDPTNPTLVWAGQGDQFSHDVQLHGDFAYVRSTGRSPRVFDITDPLNAVSLGQLPSVDAAAIAIVGDLLYVGTSTLCCQADLRVYDLVSDPLNPVLLGSLNDVGEKTTALAIEGDYAYVVDATTGLSDQNVAGWASTMGLAIFDLVDPANPTLLGTFKTHGNVTRVEIVGNRAYVHDDDEGLIILDVSDPTKPVRLGNYLSPAVLRQMEKVGDLLYIADAWNGFTVLNVADTTQPEVVGVYLAEHCNDLYVNALKIDVQENLVHLAAGHLGLEVVDVSNPANPIMVAHNGTSWDAHATEYTDRQTNFLETYEARA